MPCADHSEHVGRTDVAVVILRRRESVLIGRRPPTSHLAGYWEFPGGKCLPGESAQVCAVREAREELGVDVEILQAWEPVEHRYPGRWIRLYPFVGTVRSGEPYPHGSIDLRWVPLAELTDYLFPEANAPLVDRLVAEAIGPESFGESDLPRGGFMEAP